MSADLLCELSKMEDKIIGSESIEQKDAEVVGDDEDNLDDFFAKKDKGKKNKKKKKYITTEALAKTLERINTGEEEEVKKTQKKEKEGPKTQDGTKGVNNNDGEEWHEFEDESERDYSDLKIQNFQISEEKQQQLVEPQYNEQGELIPPKEEEGPWRNLGGELTTKSTSEPVPVRKADVPPEQPVVVSKSVYRPPHARLGATSTSSPSGIPFGSGRRRRPQEAPVINSEIDFPSLSSAVQDTEQHVGFETVKSGAKSISRSQQQQQQNAAQPPSLKLGNQFEALRD